MYIYIYIWVFLCTFYFVFIILIIYFSLLTMHFRSCLNPISILSASDVCECCTVLCRNPFHPMAIRCPSDVKYFWCEWAISHALYVCSAKDKHLDLSKKCVFLAHLILWTVLLLSKVRDFNIFGSRSPMWSVSADQRLWIERVSTPDLLPICSQEQICSHVATLRQSEAKNRERIRRGSAPICHATSLSQSEAQNRERIDPLPIHSWSAPESGSPHVIANLTNWLIMW